VPDSQTHKDLIARIRERYRVMHEADESNRRKAIDDIRFVSEPGQQWDAIVRRERGSDRPMYEFNKLRVTIKRIINDMRANRPRGKVRAAEDGDTKTASVLEGLIRNVWENSDGDTVIDAAAEFQVSGGFGAWRVTTKYVSDDVFDQDVCVTSIRNPFCLYWDPAAKDFMKRDAEDWFLTERISKKAYQERYPKVEVVNFESESTFDDEQDWEDEETVRIGEYWWREPVDRTIVLLGSGAVADAATLTPELIEASGGIVRERAVRAYKIMMCIASGDAILEGPTEWAGKHFPFVVVFGDQAIIEGETRWFGLVRFAKDAQRAYNYSRTNVIESIALAPQAQWWATPEQALGHTAMWSTAHKKNFPFLMFNADPKQPGPPQRMAGAMIPPAVMAEVEFSSEDIKGVTGIYDASLGQRSNETSGRAITARQRQGEIATFNYMDNLAKGVRRTWEILVDLIPRIYDTQKSVRILGADGAEDYAEVNVINPVTGESVNDLARGRYDVSITVGPSFATQRQEAAETYTQMLQSFPPLAQVAGDLIMKSMDLPYADEISERIKALLPPEVQQLIGQDKAVSPEVAAAMAQAQAAMAQVQQHGQLVQQASAELEQKSAEVDKQVAQLETKRAQFDAEVARKLAEITKREADLILKQAQAGATVEGEQVRTDRESLATEVQKAVAEIQTMAAQFMTEAAAVIADIQAKQATQVFVNTPPTRKQVRIRRVNGELVGEVEAMPEAVPEAAGALQ
jgi:hypothetical protein